MVDHYKDAILSQFEAALWMLNDCVERCPNEHWAGPTSIVGTLEFWYVVHHVLSWTDRYLTPNEQPKTPRPEYVLEGHGDALGDYAGPPLSKAAMARYITICLAKAREVIAAETSQSLLSPSAYAWVPTNRAELHLYNLRHIMHHTGQLSATLRRLSAADNTHPRWGVAGWV